MRLTTSGIPQNFGDEIVGPITLGEMPPDLRRSTIRLLQDGEAVSDQVLNNHKAVLSPGDLPSTVRAPRIDRIRHTDHFRAGDVIVLEPGTGFVRSLFRKADKHHSIFVTEQCNSNCLMCSQPPKDRDDAERLTRRNLQLIQHMDPPPTYVTITGGEPTLLGEKLFVLLEALKKRLPETEVHMLTNGRTFAQSRLTAELAAIAHSKFSVGIPLYSDVPGEHDYIVQSAGAFDETVTGFHQLARYGIRSEVRVVLHKLTIPRLHKLMEYIYRNLTFVEHIALMGLEQIGYTPRNLDELWIDPYDYQRDLEEAVEYLRQRNMPVSIYNHQLCLLPRALWKFARKSISDWKNIYDSECDKCTVAQDCGGFFKWATKRQSDHIRALT